MLKVHILFLECCRKHLSSCILNPFQVEAGAGAGEEAAKENQSSLPIVFEQIYSTLDIFYHILTCVPTSKLVCSEHNFCGDTNTVC